MTALQDMTAPELYGLMTDVQKRELSIERYRLLADIDEEWNARMAYNPANKRWDG